MLKTELAMAELPTSMRALALVPSQSTMERSRRGIVIKNGLGNALMVSGMALAPPFAGKKSTETMRESRG